MKVLAQLPVAQDVRMTLAQILAGSDEKAGGARRDRR
jgi:hypothetical protein